MNPRIGRAVTDSSFGCKSTGNLTKIIQERCIDEPLYEIPLVPAIEP